MVEEMDTVTAAQMGADLAVRSAGMKAAATVV